MYPHLKHREQPYAPCIPAQLGVVLKRQLRGTDLCGQGKLARGHGARSGSPGRLLDASSQPCDVGPMQLRWTKIYTLPEKKTHGYSKGSALERATPFQHGKYWYQFVRFLECNSSSQVTLKSHHLFKKVTNIPIITQLNHFLLPNH